MSNLQALVSQIDAEIRQTAAECEATRQQLLADITAAERARDKKIAELSARRDAEVLKEKLKDYPATLVNNHKTCAMCGGLMRPYRYMEGEKIVKAWACQAGGLSDPNHDLIRV